MIWMVMAQWFESKNKAAFLFKTEWGSQAIVSPTFHEKLQVQVAHYESECALNMGN